MEVLVVAGAIAALALYESSKSSKDAPKKPDSGDGGSGGSSVPPPDHSGSTGGGSTDSGGSTSTPPVVVAPSTPLEPPKPVVHTEKPQPYTFCLTSDGTGNFKWDQSHGATTCPTPNYNPSFVGQWNGGKYTGSWSGHFIDPVGKCTPDVCNPAILPSPWA